MKSTRLSLLAALFLFLGSAVASAQLPDPSVDIQLGLKARAQLLEHRYVITTTPEAKSGQAVFQQLLTTSPVKYSGLPFNWNMSVLSGDQFNASATSGGHVYVYNGLARLLGEKKALWAAVIGHELAHTAKRHHTAAYLRALQMELAYLRQKAYYQQRAAQGDQSAQWALAGLEIGRAVGELLKLKLSRDEEHEADQVGMLMMAEAGYHPAYIFVLQNTMKTLGDPSKFKAFFSDHPRWQTRAERSQRFHRDAVARFESRWPDAALSPGGVPPPIVSLGKPNTTQDKQKGLALVRIPFRAEEGRGQELNAYLRLMRKGSRVPGKLPEYSDRSGLFLANQEVQVPGETYHVYCEFGLNKLRVFSSPYGPVTTTAKCGDEVSVLDGSPGKGWVRIRTLDGTEGYASGPFITKSAGSSSGQLQFTLPTSALVNPNQRSLEARVCVSTSDGLLMDCTKEFKVKFPKLKR